MAPQILIQTTLSHILYLKNNPLHNAMVGVQSTLESSDAILQCICSLYVSGGSLEFFGVVSADYHFRMISRS